MKNWTWALSKANSENIIEVQDGTSLFFLAHDGAGIAMTPSIINQLNYSVSIVIDPEFENFLDLCICVSPRVRDHKTFALVHQALHTLLSARTWYELPSM
jgi:hypothetical protein